MAACAKPSGRRLAFRLYMSASCSFVRMWVLKSGVYTNPRIVPIRKTSGSTAVSPIPRIFHRSPQRATARSCEQRKDKDRRNHNEENQKDDGDAGATDPPASRKPVDYAKEHHRDNSAEHDVYYKHDELVAEPGNKRLRRKSVLPLAKVSLVYCKRRAQDRSDDQKFRPIYKRLQRLEACDAFGKSPHHAGPAKVQQKDIECRAIKKIPKDQPVSALEVGLGA